jgi:alpha-methylacyl-CoA racemase
MTALFASHPSAHWTQILERTDACYAPVLNLTEAAAHPHNVARGLYRVTPGGDIETARGLRFLALTDRAADV